MHAAVAVDNVVIADTSPASLPVPAVYISYRNIFTFWRCRAVDNNAVNFLIYQDKTAVGTIRYVQEDKNVYDTINTLLFGLGIFNNK